MAKNSQPARGRGRPKGSRNKVTNEAKQAILMAFDRIGGVDRLVKWIQADPANEAVYWGRIFLRLLPRAAAEPVIEPEGPAPVTGALMWKTPDWAKGAVAALPASGSETAMGRAAVAVEAAARWASGADPPGNGA